jgi:A/G-specific adenine glycosylase
MAYRLDILSLIKWFKQDKREFPWREDPNPYGVWISEVMLQQTQASVVIPYYVRWMQRFPTIHALAQASLEEVIKLWEGLGYYSRARNLHEGAKYIVQRFDGNIPKEPELLAEIKGIGDYTSGAILSFAFHQRRPAVDGNVLRVLARYFLISEDISKAKTQAMMRTIAEEILPEHESWVVSEALIELGATICRKKPVCSLCPLQKNCQAYRHGETEKLPYKSAKTKRQQLFRAVAVIECKGSFLVRQVQEGEIMSGLHEFPFFDLSFAGIEWNSLEQLIQQRFDIRTTLAKTLPETSHSFTRFNVRLFPFHLKSSSTPAIENFKWMDCGGLEKIAFPSGHRTIFENMICT